MPNNAVFEALANPARRKILRLLRAGPKSAGEIASRFPLSKPTLSAHFNKLKEAELVVAERQGTSVIYHLNASVLEAALTGLLHLRDHDQ